MTYDPLSLEDQAREAEFDELLWRREQAERAEARGPAGDVDRALTAAVTGEAGHTMVGVTIVAVGVVLAFSQIFTWYAYQPAVIGGLLLIVFGGLLIADAGAS